MCQVNPNYCILVKCNDIYPTITNANNSITPLTIPQIEEFIADKSIYKSCDEIEYKYPVITSFKTDIKEPCILLNEEADKYFSIHKWYSGYNIIPAQTFFSIKHGHHENVIEYIFLNVPNGDYNHFIIALRIDLNYVPYEFYHNFKYYFPAEIVALCPERFYKDSLATALTKNPHKKTEITNNNAFIKLLLSYAQFHFDEMNCLYNSPEISPNDAIKKHIPMHIYPPELISGINVPLFPCQLNDIAWMKHVETTPTKFIFDDVKVVPFGNNYEIRFTESQFPGIPDYIIGPKRTIANYPPEKLNQFMGGCLASAPGLGKTLSVLTFCSIMKGLSIIAVPVHLKSHWIAEYNKFINIEIMGCICYEFINMKFVDVINGIDEDMDMAVAVSYYKPTIIITDFDNLNLLDYDANRIIIDEFHEYLPEIDNKVIKNARFRWCITSTPFIKDIYNIVNYLLKYKIPNKDICKYSNYHKIIASAFKMESAEDFFSAIKDISIKEKIIMLKMSSREEAMMDSLRESGVLLSKAESIKQILNFCIQPNLFLRNDVPFEYCCSDKDFINIFKMEHDALKQELYKLILDNSGGIMPIVEEKMIEEGLKCIPEITNIMQQKMHKLQVHLQFVEMQMKKIEDRGYTANTVINTSCEDVINDALQCSICYEVLNRDFTMLRCAHIFCSGCIQKSVDHGHTECSMCKMKLANTVCYRRGTITTLIETYGTKTAHLIQFCYDNSAEQIVLYLHDATLAANLEKILHSVKISAVVFDNISALETTQAILETTQVVILTSESKYSGLSFQNANIIILMQPLANTCANIRYIESNIVGRCRRIGQKRDISVIRFIIEHSLEEEMCKYYLRYLLHDNLLL